MKAMTTKVKQQKTSRQAMCTSLYCEAVLWIWVRMDPHHLGNLDPHPHQIEIRIRVNFQMISQNVGMEYEPILVLFKGMKFEPSLAS
jgi:hypothetical protein